MIFGTAFYVIVPVPYYLGVVLKTLYISSGLVPSWSLKDIFDIGPVLV